MIISVLLPSCRTLKYIHQPFFFYNIDLFPVLHHVDIMLLFWLHITILLKSPISTLFNFMWEKAVSGGEKLIKSLLINQMMCGFLLYIYIAMIKTFLLLILFSILSIHSGNPALTCWTLKGINWENQQAALLVMGYCRLCLMHTCTFHSFKQLNMHLLSNRQKLSYVTEKAYYNNHHIAQENFTVNNKNSEPSGNRRATYRNTCAKKKLGQFNSLKIQVSLWRTFNS